MNDKLPIIDQMHNADGDRERAAVLLRCSDAVMLKYETPFLNACRHFPVGEAFVLLRTLAMRSVRSETGALPEKLAGELETLRAALASHATGAPEWPLDAPQPGS